MDVVFIFWVLEQRDVAPCSEVEGRVPGRLPRVYAYELRKLIPEPYTKVMFIDLNKITLLIKINN